jgi:hypothetical protein
MEIAAIKNPMPIIILSGLLVLETMEENACLSNFCKLYEDLIGRMRPNPNIKDKEYWKNDTLYKVYKKWCEHTKNKFHVI